MTTEAFPRSSFTAGETSTAGQRVYRHGIAARTAHWGWFLAMIVLVMSGLQIFNAAPYLDASDKSNPQRRMLAFDAHMQNGTPVGTTTVSATRITTTGCSATPTTARAARRRARFPAG